VNRFDDFWDTIVEHGLLGPDRVGRARARHAQYGGGLDTAVIEFAALDEMQRIFLIENAASTVGLPVAPTEFIDAPDLEALARLPKHIVETYGVIPSRELGGRPVLVVPALLTHQINEIRTAVGNAFRLFMGYEVDIWEALDRFANIPSPERIEAIWTGQCPSVVTSGEMEACGPVAIPRSTILYRDDVQDYGDMRTQSPVGVCDELLDSRFAGGHSPITRPGRPQALGMADTADFAESRNKSLFFRPELNDVCLNTSDDSTVLIPAVQDGADQHSEQIPLSSEFGSEDTVPPAAG
jgi:hypothetical protein